MRTWAVFEKRVPLWSVAAPSPVFRHLEARYVEEFFDTGALRLSRFEQFRKHADEQRLDLDEGNAVIQAAGKTKDGFVQAHARTGSESYVLSASTLLTLPEMQELGYDACIEIFDTTRFALAVAEQLPGFRTGWEGHCQYVSERFMWAESDDFAAHADQERMHAALDELALAAMFYKLQSYAHQAEYRFVWDMEESVVESKAVVCPRAREFCRPNRSRS